MDKNWTNEFKDKMQDYQEVAPDGLWSDICSAMDIEPARKPLIPVFMKYAGMAAAAAIALGVILFFNEKPENNTYIADYQANDANISKPEEIYVVAKDNELYADIPSKKNSYQENKPNTRLLDELYIDIPNKEKTPKKQGLNSEKSDIKAAPAVNHKDKSTNTEKNVYKIPDNSLDMDIFDDLEDTHKPKSRKIKIGAAISGAIGNSSSQKGYMTPVNSGRIVEFGKNPESEIRLFNLNKQVSSSTKYIQPVKVGINIKGYISERWSIGTGVEWTWLRSTLREGSDSYYISSTKDMHYIGIPLNINFDIWKNNNFNVYAFAGGTMEKCIYGKNSVQYVFNHSTTDTGFERVKEKQLQWSASAGAGIQYNFTKFAGIYASPGVSWYFDNGSGVDNIYKSRPFNFSISLGIIFNL